MRGFPGWVVWRKMFDHLRADGIEKTKKFSKHKTNIETSERKKEQG